ncbi:MAG TPA: hypothetical protein GX005_04545 [Bacteroidales bacterium]|nr:hypothetical protein [Bacteroidales bacterium]
MKLTRILLFTFLFSTLMVNAQEKTENNSQTKKHNFSMDLGYSYRLSAEPNELFQNQTYNSDHYSKLRHGFQINFAYDYAFKPSLAFGFKTSAFTSGNSLSSDADLLANSGVNVKDDMYIFYVGPSFKYIFPIFSDRYNFYARATIGYMSLRNSEIKVGISPTLTSISQSSVYTGHNFGWGIDGGIDYSINDFLSVGFNAGLLGANINKLTVGEDKQTLKHSESLYRLDFSLGVRIKL